MSYRYDEFAPGEIYHVYTRSVEQRSIFRHDQDRQRFIALLRHCLPPGHILSLSTARKLKRHTELTLEDEGLVNLLGYCLMPNHVHLLVRENIERGTSQYMQRVLTGYAKYFNLTAQRSGSLFVHPFRAVLVDGDEQLLQVSRYIHLNPYVAHLVDDPFMYRWSSLPEYLSKLPATTCHPSLLWSLLKPAEYRKFVADEANYARSLADIQHLLIEDVVEAF